MDLPTAKVLIKNLLGRLERENSYFELPSGRLSKDEVAALGVLCELELNNASGEEPSQATPAPIVNMAAFARSGPSSADLRICLDFGTAMSKAWATGKSAAETLPLVIGRPAGMGDVLAIPSAVFISDNGRVFLGNDAERQQRANLNPNRARFGNLKRLLSEELIGTDLFSLPLLPGIDPTNSGLTRGDLLTLYLGWLTDLTEKALIDANTASKLIPIADSNALRATARRFAIPCFESADDEQSGGRARAVWVKEVMEDVLLRAQLLADTLSDRWKMLDTRQLVSVLAQIRRIDISPLKHLLTADAAIREPIAAGASRFDSAIGPTTEPSDVPRRRLLLVVDAGAGTTDLALFQAITPRGKTETHYALLRHSVRMNRVAGNAVDAILRKIVLKACGVDPYTGYPRSKEDFDYLQSDLDSQIRDIKRVLFEVGTAQVELKPNASGTIEASSLWNDEEFAKFGADLLQARRNTIEKSFSTTAMESLRVQGGAQVINVLLTGGSSRLPIVQALAKDRETIGATAFEFRAVEKLPDWIDTLPRDAAQRLGSVYPQCAVAIGGSVANLPAEINDLDFAITSPPGGLRRLERFQTGGL